MNKERSDAERKFHFDFSFHKYKSLVCQTLSTKMTRGWMFLFCLVRHCKTYNSTPCLMGCIAAYVDLYVGTFQHCSTMYVVAYICSRFYVIWHALTGVMQSLTCFFQFFFVDLLISLFSQPFWMYKKKTFILAPVSFLFLWCYQY